MKTIEERIKEIKHCGECAIYSMDNHKVCYLPDDGSFDSVINEMHIAQNTEKLSEAYYKYINLCILHGYSDGEIIGGIMQNEEQNKKFSVNIESVIKSLIEIKYTSVKLSEPMLSQEKPVNEAPKVKEATKSTTKTNEPVAKPDSSAGGVKITSKVLDKIQKKVNYIEKLTNKLQNNTSDNAKDDLNNVTSVSKEINDMIVGIDPTSCNEEEIAELNDIGAKVKDIVNKASEAYKANNEKPEVIINSTTTQQAAAANTVGGFSINNFIKPSQQPVKGPNMPVNNNKTTQKPTAFPHQICELTDDQIVAEVGKHFKVTETLPAYALYDLANNKYLAKKMKELDAKQRPNNPYLTQVNINEYIDIPELLQKYSLCFTMPCNDKKQIIVVLFNPNAAPDKNGTLQYPLHIFKAAKTNNANK